AQRLGAQIDRVKRLEPGVQRSLLSLELAEHLYGPAGRAGDANAGVLRAPVAADLPGPRALIGSYLATIAPAAAIARNALGMLVGGPARAVRDGVLPAHQELHAL